MDPIVVSRHVSAPIERVWEIATNLPAAADVLRGVDSIEMLTDGPFDVGTRWRETRTIMKRAATEEMWVTRVADHDSYTVEADSRGSHYVSVFRFRSFSDGTDLSLSFDGQPHGAAAKVLVRLLGPLSARSVRSALRADLDDIAQAAERPPG